jgi:hypothetical protein
MDPRAIPHEVQQLYSVSDRLASLAEQHPPRLRSTHFHLGKRSDTETLLEVPVAMKMAPSANA